MDSPKYKGKVKFILRSTSYPLINLVDEKGQVIVEDIVHLFFTHNDKEVEFSVNRL